VPLPSGSVEGDWVVGAAVAPQWSAVFTFPGTELLNSGNIATMHYGAFKKQLSSTDISNNYLAVSVSISHQITVILVGYTDAAGFGSPGTVFDRDGVTSIAYTDAFDIADNDDNDVLCFSLIKHSSGSQAFVSTSPSITSLGAALKQGTSMPSAHCAVFVDDPQDVRTTWAASSVNGVGFQIPVLASPPPLPDSPEIMGVWNGTSLDEVELMGLWTGTELEDVEVFYIT
jgi:hypothetical protein